VADERKTRFMIARHAGMTAMVLVAAIGASGFVSVAKAAGRPLGLTRTQRREIYFEVNRLGSGEVAPPGFRPKIGDAVPDIIKLNPLPARATSAAPDAVGFDYAVLYFYGMATNELLLVAPGSRKIVAVISPW
jgi:hypothetical protein